MDLDRKKLEAIVAASRKYTPRDAPALTVESLEKIARLFGAGYSIKAISVGVGLSHKTVANHLHRMGIYKTQAERPRALSLTDRFQRGVITGLRLAGRSPSEIAKALSLRELDVRIALADGESKRALQPFLSMPVRRHTMEDAVAVEKPDQKPQFADTFSIRKAPRYQRRTVDLDKPED